MKDEIMLVCERVRDSIEEFAENPDLIMEHDDAEDLLVALGLADAFTHGAVTLSKKAEELIRTSEKVLVALLDEDGEDEEDGDEE